MRSRRLRRMIASLAALGLVLAGGGCATQPPSAIANPPAVDLDVATVQSDPDRYTGAPVRWGGDIAGVENQPDVTEVEVVARPLTSGGRPRDADRSPGRFITRVPGFLDPAKYETGREFTVAGTVVGTVKRPIGGYEYRFPVVQADASQLWQPLPEPVPWYGPYGPYGPWYGPWPGPYWGPASPFWPDPCWRRPAYCW
jgi:outer membrane lipoprotein